MRELVFTEPAALWGLIAAALPLLIHLINRHRARRQPFAAIDFLLRVQKRSARRILLKQILLLIIRTLLIVALVLAAAGPVVRAVGTASGRGPESATLVIDLSLSMRARTDGRSRFERALARASEHVRAMGLGDCASVVTAGREIRAVVEPCASSPAILLRALEDLRPEIGRSDLTAALETAAALVARAPGPRRRLILLSDLAAHALRGPPRWPANLVGLEVVAVDAAEDESRENNAVLAVRESETGPSIEIQASVAHFGAASAELPVEVELGGQRLAQGFAAVEPNATVQKLFTIRRPSDAETLGRVRLRPDTLAEDDQLPFLAQGQERIGVLLINGDMRPVLHRDELYYLERALSQSGPEAFNLGVQSVTPERFGPAVQDGVRVVFLANVRALPESSREVLQDFVRAGGGLFISMGDQVDVDLANRMLGELLPWVLRDVVSLGPPDPDGVHRSGMAFDDRFPDHAVLREIAGRGLAKVRTQRAVVLEPGQAGSRSLVLLRYENGSPALIESRLGAGRVMLLTTSLDRDWTNWPARGSFLPFLQHATAYLAGRLEDRRPPEVVAYAPVRLELPDEADGLRIRPPEGDPIDLGRAALLFTGTDQLGFFRVTPEAAGRELAGRGLWGFFVRPPAEESDLRPLEPGALEALLGEGIHLHQARGPNGGASSKAGLLIFLGLLLALSEAVLIRR